MANLMYPMVVGIPQKFSWLMPMLRYDTLVKQPLSAED
jgi:hypothetical protein